MVIFFRNQKNITVQEQAEAALRETSIGGVMRWEVSADKPPPAAYSKREKIEGDNE